MATRDDGQYDYDPGSFSGGTAPAPIPYPQYGDTLSADTAVVQTTVVAIGGFKGLNN